MKQKITAVIMLLALYTAGDAQFGGFVQKVKGKVQGRVNGKVDKAIDATLDAVENKSSDRQAVDVATPGEKAPVVVSYVQYDFVAGEKVIYANAFEQQNTGELPAGWNSSGNAGIVTLNTQKGKWLQVHQNTMVLTDNDSLFTDNCTVEFDFIFHHSFNGAMLPQLSFGLISTGDLASTDNSLLGNPTQGFAAEIKIQPGTQNDSHLRLQTYLGNRIYFNTEVKGYKALQQLYDKPVHVAVQVQKERLQVWLNAEKIYDLPKAITQGIVLNQLYFSLTSSSYNDAQNGYYISHIKVARGLPDTRHKLIDEGTFATTGILFDVNTAAIEPQSSGVLHEIADVLKQNPGIKILVTGHTDNDGNEADNLKLSKERAGAVKEALVKDFHIDAGRIQADGKGALEPVADNGNKAGKAQNRRVVFRKL